MDVARKNFLDKITLELEIHSVCAILGPRQCGKTTISRMYAESVSTPPHFFDCEDPLHLTRLKDPLLTLGELSGLIIIDEIQFRPDLFPVIRVLVDRDPQKKFIITGSASRDLIHQSSETLAGRIGYIQVTPFSLAEIQEWRKLWYRGGFPKSYLAFSDTSSARWRNTYIQKFLQQDLNQMGFDITPALMARLWRILAHTHGQLLNVHTLAQSLDIDQRTIKKYLGILEGAFMITLLRPWLSNPNKREVKAPKVYIRDSGLLFQLLQLNPNQIDFYPQLGAAFEGFAVEEIIRHFEAYEVSYFWAIHSGGELDLLIEHEGRKLGFEIKHTDHPVVTKSMMSALENLKLDHLYVVIPLATESFKLAEKITVVSVSSIPKYF